jgi:hypothetical protein
MDEAAKLVTEDSNWISKFAVKATTAFHTTYSDVVTDVVSGANALVRDRHMYHQHLISTRRARNAAQKSTGEMALTRGLDVISSYPKNFLRIFGANF